MRKIFLSSGHGGNDPGATSNGFVERDLALELRSLIQIELKNRYNINAIVDAPQNKLIDTLAWLRGKFSSKDILLDIHWNAATPAAHGSEVIIPEISTQFERNLANALLRAFTSSGFRNRGVKPESLTARKRLGWMRPSAENVLVEVCFISNEGDMRLYQLNKAEIAAKIAKVLAEYAKL